MGYEKFLESGQIKFQIIKDWYREPDLLHYWADEIQNDFRSDWRRQL